VDNDKTVRNVFLETDRMLAESTPFDDGRYAALLEKIPAEG
jgi:hypothetical protein